jgi:predicted kinase
MCALLYSNFELGGDYSIALAPYPFYQGPVGAGKSWFANKLVDQSQGSWVRANQDDLGSRDEVARVAREALLAGHSALIDRTNFDVSQRSHWFNLAREVCY